MTRVIPFPIDPERESARLNAIHFAHLELDELAAELGSPEEWLTTAILHLKDRVCSATHTVSVSTAAVCLVLQRLEEFEHGGEPWRGNAA